MRRFIRLLLIIYALATATVVLVGFLGARIPPVVTVLLTILAFTFALLHGSIMLGWRDVLLLVILTFTVSLLFESLGVATGLIYGPYHYTDKLGPQVLGLVPYLIPLAWFMMMYPAWVIAERLIPFGMKIWPRRLAVAGLGAVVMTAWDLAMDPFMVKAGHWVWEVQGAYFGIPLQNFWGWWLTAFVTLLLFLIFSRSHLEKSPESKSFQRLPVFSYLINGLSSIFTDLNVGLGGASLAGFFAMLPWVVLGLFKDTD